MLMSMALLRIKLQPFVFTIMLVTQLLLLLVQSIPATTSLTARRVNRRILLVSRVEITISNSISYLLLHEVSELFYNCLALLNPFITQGLVHLIYEIFWKNSVDRMDCFPAQDFIGQIFKFD